MNNYKLYQSVGKNFGLMFITQILITPSGLILLPLLTKSLDIYDYGVWSLIIVLLELLPEFSLLQIPQAVLRFLSNGKNKITLQEGIYSSAILITISSTFMVSIIMIIGNLLYPNHIQILIVASWVLPFICLNTLFKFYFLAIQQANKFSFFSILLAYLKIGFVCVFLLYLKFGLFGAVLSIFLANFFIFIILFYLVVRDIGIAMPNFSSSKEYLSFSIPLLPSSLTTWIVSYSDRYLIALFIGVASTGYYSSGYTIGNTIFIFVSLIGVSLIPITVKSYEDGKIDDVKRVLSHSLKYFLIITIPSVFGLIAISRPLLEILTTKEIAENAYLIPPIVAAAVIMQGITRFYAQILFLKKNTKLIAVIWLVASIFNLFLNILFVPRFGMISAAVTTLIAYAIAMILTIYYSSRFFTFNIDYKSILKSLFASIVMFIFIYLISPERILSLMAVIMIGTGLYFSILFFTKTVGMKEFNFFKSTLLSFKNNE